MEPQLTPGTLLGNGSLLLLARFPSESLQQMARCSGTARWDGSCRASAGIQGGGPSGGISRDPRGGQAGGFYFSDTLRKIPVKNIRIHLPGSDSLTR